MGLSLNFATWIRDAGRPLRGRPDNCNDEVRSSLKGGRLADRDQVLHKRTRDRCAAKTRPHVTC